MPAWTAFGWKSSASVPRAGPPDEPAGSSPPQPGSAASSRTAGRIRRTAANTTGGTMNFPEVTEVDDRGGVADRGPVTEVEDRGPAAYIAEFVGTLLLVFFVTAAVSLYVSQPSGANPQPFIDFSVIGLVHVFVLFILIQTFAVVSGAHFNPAVTAVMAALRQIKPPDALIYVVAQLAGATAGALLTKALLDDEGAGENYGATTVSDAIGGDILPGMAVE